ncbi:PREDICTED: F-box/LRR-repeat protein 7-like [Branchiostoma belcheri]|uniref:F-box/LRR-repeat protein 7-like n=1 Tax=Branchiostoma belcheri TaxID=7741 RepID=A0A6P4Z215_BRABE|nr:PREDICTED: F-box/LRR-repeat protein 7-like [Branchiostoma belcheri]
MSIYDLSDPLLLQIFQFLDHRDVCLALRQTCQQWYRLSYDFTLWQRLRFSGFSQLRNEHFLPLLRYYGDSIQEIDISGCKGIDALGFNAISEHCKSLRKLNLSDTYIAGEAFLKICEECPKIKELNIFDCQFISYKVLSSIPTCLQGLRKLSMLNRLDPLQYVLNRSSVISVYQSLIKNCKELVELDCKASDFVEDDIFSDGIANLHSLNLSHCTGVSDDGIQSIAVSCSALRHLNISHTYISNRGMEVISRCCKYLTHLDVSDCRNVTDIGVCMVAHNCHELRHLDVHGESWMALRPHSTGNITDVTLKVLASWCPSLEYLDTTGCWGVTDDGVRAITTACKNLQHLEVRGCLSISDQSLLSLADNSRELRSLNISECVKVTSAGLNLLVTKCTKLQFLKAETCHYLANLRFSCQVQHSVGCSCSQLPAKDVRGSSFTGQIFPKTLERHFQCIDEAGTSSGGFQALCRPQVEKCKITPCVLSHLDLSFCSNIADDAIQQVASFCQQLKHLSLMGCYLVTDKGIGHIAKHCKLLEHLNLSCSRTQRSKLTDQTLSELAGLCHSLKHLNLYNGVCFSEKGIGQLMNRCWSLRELCLTTGTRTKLDAEVICRAIMSARGDCIGKIQAEMDCQQRWPLLPASPRVATMERNILFKFPRKSSM